MKLRGAIDEGTLGTLVVEVGLHKVHSCLEAAWGVVHRQDILEVAPALGSPVGVDLASWAD